MTGKSIIIIIIINNVSHYPQKRLYTVLHQTNIFNNIIDYLKAILYQRLMEKQAEWKL
jgi:hypothetical protein